MSSGTPLLLLSDRSNSRKAEVKAKPCEISGHAELQPTWSVLDKPLESSKPLEKQQTDLHSSDAALGTTEPATTRRSAEGSQHGNQYGIDIILQQSNEQTESVPSRERTVTRPVRTFGTPLSTILEQQSCATLDAERQTPLNPSPTRVRGVTRQVSKSLDEAALHEFQNIVTGLQIGNADISSDHTNEPVDRSILHSGGGQVAEPNYAIAFVRSATPPGHSSWPGDQVSTAATNSSRPPTGTGHPTTKKGWLLSIRDFLRITTPSEHGQTAFSRESIRAARSTSRPAWQASRNSFNYRGKHPFELTQSESASNGSHKASRSCDERDCMARDYSGIPSCTMPLNYLQISILSPPSSSRLGLRCFRRR
jgi:hypothetical protein